MEKIILIVPAFERGRGGGHLVRCLKLTEDLCTIGKNARLYLPSLSLVIDNLFKSMNFNSELLITESKLKQVQTETVDFIILDRFQTPLEELTRWKQIAPVIGIDEGGQTRGRFDFLIDILTPEKSGKPPANIVSPSLLKFPPKQITEKKPADGIYKILISFGQEDPAGLGLIIAKALSENNEGMEITLLCGGLMNNEELKNSNLRNINIMQSIPNLSKHLCEYDLLITHYGITAYEALYAGTSILLASPTKYHEKMARAAGFKTISSKSFSSVSMRLYDKGFREKLKNYCEKLAAKHKLHDGTELADLINNFSPQIKQKCPVCDEKTNTNSIARFNERTYRRCDHCGIIYMDRICPPPIEYEREYFFEKYKQQYGKTYIEDFPNLTAMAKRRLKIIKKTGERGAGFLLDIGCAYGPFLAAAREEGFFPAGIDPAEDAVCYVQKKLGIPAVHGFFPGCPIPNSSSQHTYDIVTLWFVIEHFYNCVPVLAEIRRLLKPGGILAFSTPSFSGISGLKSLEHFLERSPADHFTIWSPKMCKKALSLAGFRVKKTVVCGHHSVRFPVLGKTAKSKKSPVYWLLLAISRIFGLGDTFEVYAEAI